MFDSVPECVATQAAKDRAMAYWTDTNRWGNTYEEQFWTIVEGM